MGERRGCGCLPVLLHAGGGQDELVDLGLLGRVEVDEVGVWNEDTLLGPSTISNDSLLQLPSLPPLILHDWTLQYQVGNDFLLT